MKITTLIENSKGKDEELYNEHGLSFFIEASGMNILFDTGQTGNFMKNAEKLNIKLDKTDYLILSHAHYDHCGGVKEFLNNVNVKPKLYIGNTFFENSNKYHCSDGNLKLDFACDNIGYKYIGIDFDEEFIKDKNLQINYVKDDIVKVNDKIYIFSNFEKNNKIEKLNSNMKIKKGENYIIDTFDDEIVLAVESEKGLIILLGCSHPGILNIVDTINKRTGKKICGIIGGTHLVEADEHRVKETIEHLKRMDIKFIGVSHCTGEKAVNMFKENFDNFFKNCTGTIIEI